MWRSSLPPVTPIYKVHRIDVSSSQLKCTGLTGYNIQSLPCQHARGVGVRIYTSPELIGSICGKMPLSTWNSIIYRTLEPHHAV
jgi:hypothetical protein